MFRKDSHTILIIDDSKDCCQLIKEYLIYSGVNVLCAYTGKEGIDLFRKHKHIKKVVLDIKLPDISANHVCLILRNLRPATPIYAISADVRYETIRAISRMQFSGVFYKPINLKELDVLLTV